MPNMSLTRCPMPSQDPAVRSKNFDEVALGYTYEMAVEEAKRCLHCKHQLQLLAAAAAVAAARAAAADPQQGTCLRTLASHLVVPHRGIAGASLSFWDCSAAALAAALECRNAWPLRPLLRHH